MGYTIHTMEPILYGHSESRDGHHTTGEYYVHLPDGRIQRVSYYVDEHGYHPTITYEGTARFPGLQYGHTGPTGGRYH